MQPERTASQTAARERRTGPVRTDAVQPRGGFHRETTIRTLSEQRGAQGRSIAGRSCRGVRPIGRGPRFRGPPLVLAPRGDREGARPSV